MLFLTRVIQLLACCTQLCGHDNAQPFVSLAAAQQTAETDNKALAQVMQGSATAAADKAPFASRPQVGLQPDQPEVPPVVQQSQEETAHVESLPASAGQQAEQPAAPAPHLLVPQPTTQQAVDQTEAATAAAVAATASAEPEAEDAADAGTLAEAGITSADAGTKPAPAPVPAAVAAPSSLAAAAHKDMGRAPAPEPMNMDVSGPAQQDGVTIMEVPAVSVPAEPVLELTVEPATGQQGLVEPEQQPALEQPMPASRSKRKREPEASAFEETQAEVKEQPAQQATATSAAIAATALLPAACEEDQRDKKANKQIQQPTVVQDAAAGERQPAGAEHTGTSQEDKVSHHREVPVAGAVEMNDAEHVAAAGDAMVDGAQGSVVDSEGVSDVIWGGDLYARGMLGLRAGMRPAQYAYTHHPWLVRKRLRWGALAFTRRRMQHRTAVVDEGDV